MMKNEWSVGVVFLVACILLGASCAFAEEPSTAGSAFSKARRASLDVFTLEVEMDLPVILLAHGQGTTTRILRVTVGKDVTAMAWRASRLPPPKYFPPNTHSYQPIDYDDEGNLILWMPAEGATICSLRIHEEYSSGTSYRVAPDGRIVLLRKNSGTFLRRYSPSYSNTSGLGILRTIRLALGRPPVDALGELVEESVNQDGATKLRTTGRYSPYSGSGVWEFLIDPGNGQLVRRGSFATGAGEPWLQFWSEGTRRFGEVVLAQRGEYTLGPQHIVFRLISFKPEFDPAVVAEARKIIAKARTRLVQVFDYREDPTRAKVRLVPAGDLDKD